MADGHGHGIGERAKFREMLEGTKEDWEIIAEHSRIFNKGLAKRVLDHLKLLDGDFGGSTGWSIRCRPRPARTATAGMRNMSSAPCCTILAIRWAA